jgi:hypothetical protein
MTERTLPSMFVFLALGACSSAAGNGDDTVSAGGGSNVTAGGSATTGGSAGSVGGSAGSSVGGSTTSGGAVSTGGSDAAGGSGASAGTSNGGSGEPLPPATGEPGVWENVTPAGVDLVSDFGVQDVVVDPARPQDFYVGVCKDGFYRSTDYGLTWTKVSTGTNGSVLATGRPWTLAIDNNAARDPGTPPTLYTANGYGSQAGVFKSTDGGENWSNVFENEDIYSLEMDPYDNQHLITGYHEGPGLAETTDGGENWNKIDTGAIGKSIYPHFVDTGDAETTAKTWIVIPQVDSGTAGFTTNGGTSFSSVGGMAHGHGGNQAFNAGPNLTYVAASGGVYRSTNSGANWNAIEGSTTHGYANGVLGTATTLYTWDDGANGGGINGAYLLTAPRDTGNTWTSMTSPNEMNNGGKSMAASSDGEHYVLVSGNWNAGVWRYVEP